MLYIWIDSMRPTKLPVSPSLVKIKEKQFATQLSISEDDFKASWQWLKRFRERKGLQKVLLHGEEGEVNKNDLEVLAAFNNLYVIVEHYDP